MTSIGTNNPTVEPQLSVGVQELGHIVLYVHNAERSATFYGDVLGWNRIHRDPVNQGFAMFSGGRTHHELLLIEVGEDASDLPKGRHVGLYHFGLKVGDTDAELKAMLQRLQKANVQIVGATDHGFTHSLYILDPDGNEVELYIDVPDMDWFGPNSASQAAKPLRL